MPAEVDYKAIKAQFDDGMRRLIHLALSSPELANEPAIVEFRKKTAEFDKRVTEIKARSADILATKERFQQLTLARDKQLSNLQNAEKTLQALSQQVGEAAFKECLAGRLVEFPALQSRKDIQQQIDDLVKRKADLDHSEKLGFADKTKKLAESTILAGRITLLKQKIASADKTLGGAVIETHREEEILATNAADLLSKVCAARTAIYEQASKLKDADRQLEECRKHAESIGVTNTATSAFDVFEFDLACKRSTQHIEKIEYERQLARKTCGQAVQTRSHDAPSQISLLAAELCHLQSICPEVGKAPSFDKTFLVNELKEQLSLLFEIAGNRIFADRANKERFSREFGTIVLAKGEQRAAALRQLAEVAIENDKGDITALKETVGDFVCAEIESVKKSLEDIGNCDPPPSSVSRRHQKTPLLSQLLVSSAFGVIGYLYGGVIGVIAVLLGVAYIKWYDTKNLFVEEMFLRGLTLCVSVPIGAFGGFCVSFFAQPLLLRAMLSLSKYIELCDVILGLNAPSQDAPRFLREIHNDITKTAWGGVLCGGGAALLVWLFIFSEGATKTRSSD